MILLKSLICLLLIIIFLHFFKFLKDRNTKREGFSEINNSILPLPVSPQSNTETPDLNGEIIRKMKENNTNKNKDVITKGTKTHEEMNIEKQNKEIAKLQRKITKAAVRQEPAIDLDEGETGFGFGEEE